ncbi:transcription elongation factor SPT6 [Uranotaenia lowii]|uniref:transcription elongation factor SPT6 n=1 Tax=Uranotaenia lowii TaxID=190385 RepID=UPI00247A89A0|nr:transcription elongation factor SPT6 [Uranotaenia lowii]XP_055593413.1 transcription elongation factor SPT6 [Uranotaenia lowii]XP_055593421.1 transcription elongation factor SPT6 [Uranotaenia lowii]
MADFIDSEAEESEQEEDLEHERKKLKKIKAMSDSEEEEEDDDERLREELKDLIDDNPIEEDDSAGEDSDASGEHVKRKKSDDEDELDDRLEDEDYDLIEENLGVKVERKRFKRLKKITDEGSDEELVDEGLNREVIAEQLFDLSGDEEDEHHTKNEGQRETRAADVENFDEEDDDESDADDFIVDDDGVPISDKRKKKKHIFTDASLQEGQDIFGVDFDYDEFDKIDDDEYEDDSEGDDEYEDDGPEAGEERARRPKKQTRKKIMKKTIFDIFEPSELKRGHFTDMDNEIRKTDIPERMQLRDVPVTPTSEGTNELEEEAEWIYKQAFNKSPVSNQESYTRKPESTIPKIKQALDFLRNQNLEVPFIAFYRKEYVQPELNINDLWKVYKFDAKWCQLSARKNNLLKLFENMRNYQLDTLMEKPDAPIPEDMRIIKDDDVSRLKSAQTPEELKDVHNHFLLYHAHEIPAMQEKTRKKEYERKRSEKIEARKKALESSEDVTEDIDLQKLDIEDIEPYIEENIKLKIDAGPYAMCRKGGLSGLAKRFGLSPEQYAENVRDSYQRHEVEQETSEPSEVASEYVTNRFNSVEDVLYAAKFMVARQLAKEPLLRKCVREIYYERAKLSVRPSKKGIKEIDENHPCYTMKYIKDKPVRDLTGDQFLKLHIAQEDKLLIVTISELLEGSSSSSDYLDEMKQLYQKDEFSKNVQEWNKIRSECVELAFQKMILPDMRKELQSIVLQESKDAVLKICCRKLYNWIKVGPYVPAFEVDEDDYDFDTSRGIRVMGLAFVPDYTQSAFAAITSPDGEVTDYLRIPHLMKRKNSYRQDERQLKEADLQSITDFIRNKKPHVIAVGGESRDAFMIQKDLQDCVKTLVEEDQFPEIAVEIVDNELAKIYSNSNKGAIDFRDYPMLLRQAISLARRMQDPLVEFSQLCTADEEILCLRYHSLQDHLNKEELLENLYLEFINRTNEVGVDVNLTVQNSVTLNLVQFICGLGPRKGQALIKVLKQTNQRLENRTQLVTVCHMGPKVFINCSGFIKIDTNSLGDSTEAYVEVLDGSRVHPETYEWARKMAVDALEYDDEDANPAGALEEILESPERLKDLDLDAFAVELERQGFGNKSITLYDIRAELNSRYKDLRTPFKSLTTEELFDYLTKETPETLYVGKLLLATVSGISHRKPQGDQLDQANPVRNDETGLWQCPFCMQNEFPELSEVWNHFDAGECPGQATGVRLRFDNGLTGFIHIKNISDKHVKNPEERVQMGQTIHVRITKIDVEKFNLDCTSKSSDLADKNGEWRPRKDQFYDTEAEDRDIKKESDVKKQQQRQHYIKRVIVHPSFHNISYNEALKLLKEFDQGEVIVRPSSKGADHLTASWKVANDIYQHIDIREEGKENDFSLGQSLWIGNEEFEDLDEIIARHINPMASYVRDLLNYKYFKDTQGGLKERAEEILKEEKKKNPNKIHYVLSVAKHYPGKFLLSYLPRNKFKHEYVTITPEGYRFRQQTFDSVNSFLKWFKEHFRDPIPMATPTITPRGTSNTFRTPYSGSPSIKNDAFQKNSQTTSSQMLNSSSYSANNTPRYGYTPGDISNASNYVTTPYTPSGQTPYMTPYHQTPHSSQTPRYGSYTPSHHSNSSFVHPGSSAIPSRTKQRYDNHSSASPYDPGTVSPYSSENNLSRSNTTLLDEDDCWDEATDAWSNKVKSSNIGQSKPSFHAPQDKPRRQHQHNPRQQQFRLQGKSEKLTSRSYPPRSNSDQMPSPQYKKSSRKSPTAQVVSSLGDSTPLWDE